MDVNGDGKVDIVEIMYPATGVIGLITHFSQGDGTYEYTYHSYPEPTYYSLQSLNTGSAKYEIVATAALRPAYLRDVQATSPSNTFAFTSWVSKPNGAFSYQNSTYLHYSAYGEVVLDMNSDGRDDVLRTYASGSNMLFYAYLGLDNGQYTSTPVQSVYAFPYYYSSSADNLLTLKQCV